MLNTRDELNDRIIELLFLENRAHQLLQRIERAAADNAAILQIIDDTLALNTEMMAEIIDDFQNMRGENSISAHCVVSFSL
jgi:hypothetical protein